MNPKTRLITAGRKKEWAGSAVNPSVQRASTVLFESVADMRHAIRHRADSVPFYGRRGTSTTFAFIDAMRELEGCAGCYVYPSGTAALANSLLAFLKSGDHLLMVDSVYEPTRDLCEGVLNSMGIETTYYDPLIGSAIETLIKPNTKVIFLESPGSITMEVQDVPAITTVAKKHNIVTMLDNTWAASYLFNPFDFGVDISIQAATKYIVGHSDVMLGTASATDKYWPRLREHSYQLGQCTSPDDLYLALRGLRTLPTRMKQHQQHTEKVVEWVARQPEVAKLLHPQFSSCPGHEFFKRDFLGSNGLFSFIVEPSISKAAIEAMIDSFTLFKLGFSWGGFESLVMYYDGLSRIRKATAWENSTIIVRLHIGLEDPDDLIADLKQGFNTMRSLC